jgi:hypothetical protein
MKWMSEWCKGSAAGVVIALSVAMSPACADEDPGDPGEPGDRAASDPVVSRAVQEPPGAHCPEGGTAMVRRL